jgi:FlaA1/EpsC-like NDP-sugar epimerase
MALIRRETAFLLAGDLALLVFSLWLALSLRVLHIPNFNHFVTNTVAFIPVFLISIIVFFIAGLYEKQTRLVKRVMGSRIFGAQVANTTIAAVMFFLLPLVIAPKTILVLYLIISVLLIQAWRFYITPRLSVRGKQLAVLVGHGESVKEVFEEVNNNNRYRLHFAEHIDTGLIEPGTTSERIRLAIQNGARIIVLDTRDADINTELPALYDAMVEGVSFVEFVSFYEDLFDRVPLAHIDNAWLLACLPKRHIIYDMGKRFIDIVGSTIGMVLAAIFILFGALALLTEGGEVENILKS